MVLVVKNINIDRYRRRHFQPKSYDNEVLRAFLTMTTIFLLTYSSICHGFSSSWSYSSYPSSFWAITRKSTTRPSFLWLSPRSLPLSLSNRCRKKVTKRMSMSSSEDKEDENFHDHLPSSLRSQFVSDVVYGMEYVHTNFLQLSWRLYSRSVLILIPFIVLLFVILPTLSITTMQSSSSSPLLTLERTIKIQKALRDSLTTMSKISDQIYLQPLLTILSLIPINCFGIGYKKTSNGITNNNNAWSDLITKKKQVKVWGLFWAPIFEELFFRYGIYKLWTAMFRSLSTASSSSSSSSQRKKNKEVANNGESIERVANSKNKSNMWMIISGIWFGISHFRNFLPLLNAIDNNFVTISDHRLNYWDIAGQEKFLIRCMPSKFLLQDDNGIVSQYILTNIVLVGALFQCIHCFLNTIQLYSPLFMKSHNNGGIGSSIGAHILWNINVSGLIVPFMINIKIRILLRIVKRINKILPNQKRTR